MGRILAGNTDKLSVAPGERQRFMVTMSPPGRYTSRLVRVGYFEWAFLWGGSLDYTFFRLKTIF